MRLVLFVEPEDSAGSLRVQGKHIVFSLDPTSLSSFQLESFNLFYPFFSPPELRKSAGEHENQE